MQARAGAACEPFRDDEREQRNRDCYDDQTQRRRLAARHLRIGVDRGRDRLGHFPAVSTVEISGIFASSYKPGSRFVKNMFLCCSDIPPATPNFTAIVHLMS
jgi:hypothetical protein